MRAYVRQAACLVESYLRHHPAGCVYVLHADDGRRSRHCRPGPRSCSSRSPTWPSTDSRACAPAIRPSSCAMRSSRSCCATCCAPPGSNASLLRRRSVLLRLAEGRRLGRARAWRRCSHAPSPDVPPGDPDLMSAGPGRAAEHGVYTAASSACGAAPTPHGCWTGGILHPLPRPEEAGRRPELRPALADIVGFRRGMPISRHPGLNAVYWNLYQRTFTRENDRFLRERRPAHLLPLQRLFAASPRRNDPALHTVRFHSTARSAADLRRLPRGYAHAGSGGARAPVRRDRTGPRP